MEYLHDLKQTLLNAFEHQHYPCDIVLVEQLQLPVDRSRAPLFDILVIGQDFCGRDTCDRYPRRCNC